MKPFIVMELLARAKALEAAGHSVIHMEVGEPDLPPPEPCRAAAIAAVDEHRNGYTASFGLPELQRAIAGYYRDVYGVAVDPARVVATTGTSGAFLLALGGLFRRGDRIAVTDPGYPCYPNFCEFLGLEAVRVPVDAADGFRPRLDRLDAALAQGPVAGMILTSPSNPTGAMLPRETYRAVLERVPTVISDEIYHGITYETTAESFAGHTDRAIIINSFSKYFSMTGWRLGWMVVPDHLRDVVERLQQNLYICAPHVSQVAGLAAFDCTDELDSHVARYAEHRTLLIDGLAAAGIDHIAAADGAFYVYADVSHLTNDSMDLCHRWLDQLGVASTPGLDFDLSRGHRFVRFSYAGDRAHLEEACGLLAGWKP